MNGPKEFKNDQKPTGKIREITTGPIVKDPKTPGNAIRVELSAHPDFSTEFAIIWVQKATVDGGKTVLTPIHPYPDFAPTAGLFVRGCGPSLIVESVAGKTMTCVGA